MAESSELKIVITADDRAKNVLSENKASLLDLGKLAGGAVKVGMAAGAAGAAGVAALGAGLFASVSAAGEAELAQADLNAVLASTKGAAGLTADQLNLMASQLQDVTRFEDDTTLRGEAMLLTFTNIGKNVFPQATESMLDLATKMGMDVGSAAVMLGKALNDPVQGVTALRRVGVQLTEAQEAQIKSLVELGDVEGAQKIILQELQTEVGGAARAAGDTFVGKLDILKNKFGDVQESIGGAILPSLTLLGDKLIEVLNKPEVQEAIKSLSDWLANNLPKAIEGGTALLADLKENGITGVLKSAQVWVNTPETQAMFHMIGSTVGQGIVSGVRAVVTNAPTWAAIGTEIGQQGIVLGGHMAKGVILGLAEGLTGQSTKGGLGINVAGLGLGIKGYQSGGVVPGPMGAPQLAMVHGGETITPAGGGSSGNFTFIYSPTVSLADEREIQTKLAPVLERWWSNAKRARVA